MGLFTCQLAMGCGYDSGEGLSATMPADTNANGVIR